MSSKKINKVLMAIFIASTIMAVVLSFFRERTYAPEKLAERFQHTFLLREKSARLLLQNVFELFKKEGTELFSNEEWVKDLNERFDMSGEIIMVTRGDSIVFISHNSLPLDHNFLPRYDKGAGFYQNGWYYKISNKYEDYQLWVFSLIKKEYRYRNKFLPNEFHSDFCIPAFVSITDDSAAEGQMIFSQAEDYVFTLVFPPPEKLTYVASVPSKLAVTMAFVSLLVLLALFFRIFSAYSRRGSPLLATLGFFVSLLVTRFVMFYYQFPQIFYRQDIFSASHYAASYWLPSLGELFLTVLFILVFSFFLFSQMGNVNPQNKIRKGLGVVVSFILLLFNGWLTYLLLEVLKGIVINSSLYFDVNFILNIDIFHLTGILVITGMFFSYLFLSSALCGYLSTNVNEKGRRWQVILLSLISASLLYYFFISDYFLLWFLIYVTSFFSLLNRPVHHKNYSLVKLLFSFFVFAILSTYALFVFNKEKEISHRQNVALRIASEQDPLAEFLFHELEDDLFDDYMLTEKVMADPYNQEEILTYLKTEYFTDFWARYDIQITVCAPGEVLFFEPFDETMVCDEYFEYYAEYFGRPTLSDRFLYLDNNTGRNSYLTILPIVDYQSETLAYTVYIEFESRFIPKELGFPELLVDEQIDITRNLGNYSYAIYKNSMLTHKFGPFFFSIDAGIYGETNEPFMIFEKDGYSHLLYNRDNETRIIVSKPRETLLEKVAPFSYLFIFFLIAAIMFWYYSQRYYKNTRFSLNFKKRLQLSVVVIVLVSVVAIGGASVWFIFNIYKNKNEAIINEKAHSILIELENNLSEEPYLTVEYEEYLNQLLLSFSNIFFTDINIFMPDGSLLASSRPRIFNEGLMAPLMHPVAYSNMVTNAKSLFIHRETIGNLEYISAYVPLRNIQGQLIAYINLPYFAQQSELRSEISFFLVAFINIYLLLLLISILIAFFISNYVTRPLQIIRNSISRLSIGKTNEKINWNRNDEIGQLVGEYNRMIDELSISADLLARSERESAWREMAKQVAHEIKNPLTPMRLNVQYLQKAWHDKADDWEERLDRFTKTMVEQIDNLTVIASEFSDFAKMPTAKNEIIDLEKFIPEVIDLYKGFEKVIFDFEGPKENGSVLVYADRKQLLRVFNNLIKNAIQAYDKTEISRIELSALQEDNYCRIEVRDFGIGIDEDLKKNIFQPYFTTKTAGMGLGLAMVKSIIQSLNGHISFESQKGKGTSFIIRLPRVSE